MKFSAARDALLNRLALVSRAASTRSAIPALGGILFKVGEGSVRLEATDVEIGLAVDLDAVVDAEGTAVLPARLLVDVVRSLPEEQVTFARRPAEGDVEVTSGGAVFHIRALAADEFPRLPEAGEGGIQLPAGALVDTIERVARAASRDEARPILTGILVLAEGTELTMVATDSYRLSVKRTQLAEGIADGLEANVPARALRELARIVAADQPEAVEISMLGNQIVLTAGEAVLSSRLIEGQFPNYKQLLPESFEHELRLPRDEVLEVVRRIKILAQRNAPLRLGFRDGELTVSAQTPDVGEASESLPAPFQGEEFEIGFNPDFLQDGLETVEGEEIVLKLISPLRPGLIEPVGSEDFSYLAMPIRLNT